MDTLRNLPTDAPANLASLIDIREGRVVSMSLSKSDTCQIMLMAFGSGESVSEEIYFVIPFTLYLKAKCHFLLAMPNIC